MPGAIALQLIGEAAEDELLRSVASYGSEQAVKKAAVARAGGPDNVDYISLQAMKRNPDDPTEEIATYPDDPEVEFWSVSMVPNTDEEEWHSEDFKTFAEAEARAKELSAVLGGRAIYTE